jgi:hypothetical protein
MWRPAFLLLLTTACGAGWHRVPSPAPGPLAPRQQAQLWEGEKAHQVHAVIVGPDSISAIPFFRPIECDSCRMTLPRSSVDSVRLGSPMAGFWKSVGLVMAVFALACAQYCVDPGT